MFFYNPLKGLKDLPQKNLKQLSIVMGVGLVILLIVLLSIII
jgi:hypothetical protein